MPTKGTGAIQNPDKLPEEPTGDPLDTPWCNDPEGGYFSSECYAQTPSVTGSSESNRELEEILLDEVLWSLLSCGKFDYCDSSTADVNGLVEEDLLDFARPTAIYSCGSSASGATITCVDAQRLPSKLATADAVTFGNYIFCSGSCHDYKPSLVAHEMVHVRQWELMGSDAFTIDYLIESSTSGSKRGDGNPLEDEAYAAQDYMHTYWGEK